MRIGMVGLGRMGGNMTRRLAARGHSVVGVDHDPAVASALASELDGVAAASDLRALVDALAAPRLVWVMVPAGAATTSTVESLIGLLEPGDTLVNGGNCRWTDSLAYAEQARAAGIGMIDAGVSGGVWGLSEGYCLMVGGSEDACAVAAPLFEALAPPGGHARVGGPGAGHFAKMVHNGIEYGLMQAYAEGFDLLNASEFDFDLAAVADVWRNGSVVRSWLLDLTAAALAEHGDLDDIAPYVQDSGEGRWTVEAAVEHGVQLPAITASLFARFASRRESFGDRLNAALRDQFGGHAIKRRSEGP